ncbi:MAG: hypothetical protein IJQ21_12595 [Lachnospiraceae bacterium]|nr:hypothetical protein [Lachnospiraceae bacterium]
MTNQNENQTVDDRLQKARIGRALFFVLVLADIATAYWMKAGGHSGMPVSMLWFLQLYLLLKYCQSDVSVRRHSAQKEAGALHWLAVALIVCLLTAWIFTEQRVRGWFVADVICYGYLLYFIVLNIILRRQEHIGESAR